MGLNNTNSSSAGAPLDPYLKLHTKANDRTMPATFKRGIINAVNAHAGTADVQLVGNQATVLKGIYLSSAINPRAIRPGDKCRVDMFSEINPSDMIVAYIYGRVVTTTSSGLVTINTPSSNPGFYNFSIAHNLGVIPTMVMVSSFGYQQSAPGGITVGCYISGTGPGSVTADNNYLYGTIELVNVNTNRSFPVYWFASCV